MLLADSPAELEVIIAAAADYCLKPWRHAVVSAVETREGNRSSDIEELMVRIECRDIKGQRQPHRDLELEIYPSGSSFSLMLSWWGQPSRPMLWQGHHPVWMDGLSGRRCTAPQDGLSLEVLARRLHILLRSQSISSFRLGQ